jgi:hypothetical protein
MVTVRSLGVFETRILVEAADDSEAQDKAAVIAADVSNVQLWRAIEPRGVPDTEQVERLD